MTEDRRNGENGRRNGDKNFGLLKELFKSEIDRVESQLREHEKLDFVRFDAAEKALSLRTKDLDFRLEGLNQLRKEVTDDRLQFVRADIFKQYSDRTKLTTGISVGSIIIAAISLLIYIISSFIRQ